MERAIVHSDINHCYAQIEEMLNPELKQRPMAVGGSQEERHGIILAKNLHAKKYKIQTGETLDEARIKCPQLLILPPDYRRYQRITDQVKAIYREYTDRVEEYGLDEAWLDLTQSQRVVRPRFTDCPNNPAAGLRGTGINDFNRTVVQQDLR